jgi:dTMP kinase
LSALLIAFEGGDASGKTTQARRVAAELGALFTREPGGTSLGETLRSLVLEPEASVDLRAEALMIAAARAQHVAQVVRPAISSGRSVVTDRFTASSLAYQGYGSGLEIGDVRALSEFATAGLWPDRTILIDVPVEVSSARLGGRPDRFEREAHQFHARVREGYLELAATDSTWVVVDGRGSVDEVSKLVDRALADLTQR